MRNGRTKVTAKALRSRIGAILACLDRGETVTIIYRKPRARLVGIEQNNESVSPDAGSFPAFGMWKDRDDMADVDTYVRDLRKARPHAD